MTILQQNAPGGQGAVTAQQLNAQMNAQTNAILTGIEQSEARQAARLRNSRASGQLSATLRPLLRGQNPPPNFPATTLEFSRLTSPELALLLQYYQLMVPPTVDERRAALAEHIGLYRR